MSVYAVLAIGGSVLAIAAIVIGAGRLGHARSGENDQESLALIAGVLNSLFIAVMAFYIVLAWQDLDIIEQRSSQEASDLIDTYWQVDPVAGAQRDQIRSLVRDYAAEVADREWPMLAAGKSDQRADELFGALRRQVSALPGDTESLEAIRMQAAKNLRDAADNRRYRIGQAAGSGQLADALFYGTIGSGVIIVLFPVLMGISSTVRHVVAIGLLTASFAASVYWMIELRHPFDGLIAVDPEAFRTILTELPNSSP